MRKVYRTTERGVALSQEINARGVTNVTLLSAVVDGGTGTTSSLTSSAFTLTTEGFRILVPSNLLTDLTVVRISYNSNVLVDLEVSLKAVASTVGAADGLSSTVGAVGTTNLADGAVTSAKVAADVATQAELDAGLAGLSGNYRVIGDIYNLKPKHFARSRILLGKVRQGAGNFKISAHGHSIVAGTGATIGATDWPAQLLSRLDGLGYPSSGTGLVGCTRSSALGTPAESRWTFGTGWGQFAGNNSALAGNSTTANPAIFTSNTSGTRVDVWYYSAGGAFTVSIDGGAAVAVTPPGGATLSVYSVTGLPNTTHTVNIVRTSGNALIWGCEVWNNGTGVRLANMGSSGSKAVNTADASFYAFAKVASNGVYGWNSHMASLMIIANDAAGPPPTAPATFKAQVQTTITNLAPGMRDILLMVDTPTGTIDLTPYIPIMYELADENDLPLLDMTKRWTGYTLAQQLGVMADVTHPNGSGYADVAAAVLRTLTEI